MTAPVSRRWPGAMLVVPVLSGACLLAFVTLTVGERSPKLIVLLLVVLIGVWLALASRTVVDLLIPAYFGSVSVAITKGLIAGAGVYAPALELTLADVCLFLLLPVWLWQKQWRSDAPAPGERTIRLAVLAFFAWAWVRALTGVVPTDGALAALSTSKYGLAFFVMLDLVRDARMVRRILVAVTATLAVHFSWIAAQFATRRLLLPPGAKANANDLVLTYVGASSAFRPTGLMLHPNTMSSYLLLVIPPALLLVLLGRRVLGRAPFYLALFVATGGIISLVLLLSRGAWVALALTAPLACFVALRRSLITRRQFSGLCFAALAAAVAVPIAYPKVLLRLTRGDQRSLESRFLMNRQATMIIRANPILGVGLAGYQTAVHRYRPAVFASYDSAYVRRLEAGIVHNHYLFTWAERGAIGVLLLLLVFGSVLLAVWRATVWHDPSLHMVAIGISAGIVGELVLFGSDPFAVDSRSGFLWTALAMLVVLLRLRHHAIVGTTQPVDAA